MANNNLKLFCLLDGDTPQNIFEVDIEITESVAKLKKCIKEEKKRRFEQIDADQLKLWSVSLRVPDNDGPIPLDIVEGKVLLPPMTRLSSVFSKEPPEGIVHFMVEFPKVAAPVASSDRRSSGSSDASGSSGSSVAGHGPKRRARRAALNQALEKKMKNEAVRKPEFQKKLFQHIEEFRQDLARESSVVPEEVFKSLARVESILRNSTPYSSIKWVDIKEIYETLIITEEQPEKYIPEAEFELLYGYLTRVHKCLGSLHFGKEAKRIHLITPILIFVCYFLDNIDILIEDDVIGKELKAHGHFEFVLKRGGKRVCIVEAKKEKMEKGLSQNLLGTEVLSEIEHLENVFGIVTNYVEWIFFRNGEDCIASDSISLQIGSNGIPNLEGLRKVTAKICGMLADD